jgi:tubulin--tyrosine ligase/tubulin polyglutamylase TTLL9
MIQKYIERPLLFKNKKFDLRCWVLVDHLMNFHYYKRMYVRLSGPDYDSSLSNIEDKFIHLTNNAIQKHGDLYGAEIEGNIIPFKTLTTHLDSAYPLTQTPATAQSQDWHTKIMTQIKSLISKTKKGSYYKLNPTGAEGSFELFGYDFMVEASGKVWLIEVNTNPCLEESNAYLGQLVPRMINDTLKKTLDRAFGGNSEKDEMFTVDGCPDGVNLW